MIARKLKTATALTPIDVLEGRLGELRARRDELTKQIIAVEKTASFAKADARADAEQVQALLDGAPFVLSREKPISELAALHAERDLIDRAIKLGESQHLRLATERAGEIWQSYFERIAACEKRRVFLALALQQANRDREMLRATITEAGGAGFLPTDSAELLGLGDIHDEVRWGAERLVSDGIATSAEIERARSDG